jgi:hypothetical protein
MERSDELLVMLAHCDERIAQNDQNISEQQRRVDVLGSSSRDGELSKAILQTFKELRNSYLMRRERLVSDLMKIPKTG